jgi:tRNA dimethylallyltransferase
MTELQPLHVIVGPTAAGKSAAALALAESVGAEIVSADAVQVYRGLDLGSAKPTPEEQARVRHHAIDIAHPDEVMDAARWRTAAMAAIADILERGRTPLVVGGTGLYIRALIFGLSPIPEIARVTRTSVRQRLAAEGPEALHLELADHDPESGERIAPRDGQRIARALEVFHETGRTLSDWQREHAFASPTFDARVLGLWPSKEALEQRITRRAARMIQSGWVTEVKSLLDRGVARDSPGLSSLGYRDVVAHLAQELPGSMLAERVATGHRRYAKRQLTWIRGQTSRDHELLHLDPSEPGFAARLVQWMGCP